MNVQPFLDDLQHTIETAPRVERTEWCRQAIRRLEAAHLMIRLLLEHIDTDQQETA